LAATLVPLAILLGLQYRWLSRLEQVSAIASRAALDNALGAIGNEIQYFYLANAERALNVPATVFSEGRIQYAAALWEKRPVEGARRLFLVDFAQEIYGSYWSYEPESHALVRMPGGAEALAIILAATPWQFVLRTGQPATAGIDVNERDPDNRMILNPIIAADGHLLGLAGMVLDEAYFRDALLPRTIATTLRKLPGAPRGVAVSVRDRQGHDVLSPPAGAAGESVSRPIPFVFSDWIMSLHGSTAAPGRWARASFAANMTLALLLAAVLLGGVGFALRAADRTMALSQLKSDFVSNVSHELRTPLASIRVFAELLRLGRVTAHDKVQEYGESIESESLRLTRLVDNILDFSRIESGRKTYRFEPVDVRAVVDSTLRSFDVRLRHDGFTVEIEAPAAPLPRVAADADALSQALANLLDNALKYSGDARRLTLRLASDADEVRIAVTDRGIGIPRPEHDKIFERFHRVGSGLVHDVKGSGLGLAIVRHIVEAHRGRIAVDSEPGRGSTFAIHLPVAGRDAPAGTAAPAATGEGGAA
jgi:signal transduction histidine kinase